MSPLQDKDPPQPSPLISIRCQSAVVRLLICSLEQYHQHINDNLDILYLSELIQIFKNLMNSLGEIVSPYPIHFCIDMLSMILCSF